MQLTTDFACVFAKHPLDVGLAECDLDWETVKELLQVRDVAKSLLPGSDYEDPTIEPTRQTLDQSLNLQGKARVLADELLHLVENDQRQRQFISAEKQRLTRHALQ
jgi:hypothetical protein